MPRVLYPLLAALAALPLMAGAQGSVATNSPGGAPLSERVVAYTIDARVDTERRSVDGTEVVTYRNGTGQPLSSFPFHLYLNAFRPESTFSRETHFGGGIRDSIAEDAYPKAKRGGITVERIEADGLGDLTGALHFTAPDDGNAEDHTVAELTLPRPLAPGESITFRLRFHDQFPLSVARNGYKRDFLMGAQWYPKVGVFSHGAWNCHQYHATTEFFSDFGTFNVHLTLPRRYVVGASGVPVGEVANGDGTRTLSFLGEDIHDFAWAASPHFITDDSIYASAMGPVNIHVLALAAHPGAGERYRKILAASLAKFEQWYGPYPYKIITLIDPEPGSEMEGMEYPTLVTGGTSNIDPSLSTEIEAEHEFGHQYWYGMVASNEFEEAWLDEGINSYTEDKAMSALYGPRRSVLNSRYINMGDQDLQRLEYTGIPDFDPVTRFAWKFRNSNSYASVTYGKTATLLRTLEGIIGEDTVREALHTYFLRFRFKHPTGEDFLRTVEEVAVGRGRATGSLSGESAMPIQPPASLEPSEPPASLFLSTPPVLNASNATAPEVRGSSLRSFFQQAVYGTEVLDYAVDKIDSSPLRWWEPPKKETKSTNYLDTVTLHRKGDFVLPVSLEVIFTDGTRVRERWDGVDRWTRFTYTRDSRIQSAEIDPEHTVRLDRDLLNNSYSRSANTTPAKKLAAIWIAVQQMAQQLAAYIV